MVESDVFQDIMAVAVEAYNEKHSHSTNEWEFNHNKAALAAVADFRTFLNNLVINLDEIAEEEAQQELELSDE